MTHQQPVISAIAAMSENHVIGLNNSMPWHMPADLKHFKMVTSGHPVIMGRKTFHSIGRPLPNRTNIILTRDPEFTSPECMVVKSAEEAISLATELDKEEVFIIGGAEVYAQTLDKIDRLYLTVIHHSFEGDAHFPSIDPDVWREVSRETHRADDKNHHDYSFVIMERQ